MRVYSGNGIGDMYYDLVRDLTEHGRKVTIAGRGDCLELPGLVILEYHQPGACWMRIPGRRLNPFFALAEVLWILSGNGNVEWISYFNKNMKSFQDGDNPELHGAYGLRIMKWRVTAQNLDGSYSSSDSLDQIGFVLRKLRRDPNSRQAVISMWDPLRDNMEPVSKDIPCNNYIVFTLRDGVLAQTVNIRSNDLVWGTPYNAIQFTHLHAYVAGLLGVKMGLFTYVIHNLHYYMDLYKPILSNLIERAYDLKNPIKAETLQNFSTFGDWDLECLKRDVNFSLHIWKNNMPFTGQRPNFEGYLKDVATLINLYVRVREMHHCVLSARDMEYLSEMEQPLRGLIQEFWDGSKNAFAQQISDFLRRNNDVAA